MDRTGFPTDIFAGAMKDSKTVNQLYLKHLIEDFSFSDDFCYPLIDWKESAKWDQNYYLFKQFLRRDLEGRLISG